MSLTHAQLKLFDHCQILQVAKMMRLKKKWQDGETWIEFHKRRIRVARAYIYWNTTGFMSDNILAKYWSWCGHVGRMCSSRQALMLSNWCSLQWKREGLASWRNKPVYDLAHKWKIRGAGKSHELLWEKRIDDYCRQQNLGEWRQLAQDRKHWQQLQHGFVLANSVIPDENLLSFNHVDVLAAGVETPWTDEFLWLQ